MLTLNKIHTRIGGLKRWYGSYVCKILLIKTVQSISAKMYYYVLFTKMQGRDTASGTVSH